VIFRGSECNGLVTTATKTGTAENCTFADLRRTIDDTKLWAYVVRQRSESMMDEMTIRVAIRTTARISFVLFLGAFLGNALYAFVPTAATRWLKANKDGVTLGFVASHTVHLAFILALVAAIGREHVFKGWIMVVAFPTGFLFIYALAAGILFRRLRFCSPRFEALAHCYLMALFVVSFTQHAITRPLFYTPFILVALISIGARVAVAIRSRKEHILGARAG
jgi:methionine sulfoxide reductase heme-binding subunit